MKKSKFTDAETAAIQGLSALQAIQGILERGVRPGHLYSKYVDDINVILHKQIFAIRAKVETIPGVKLS